MLLEFGECYWSLEPVIVVGRMLLLEFGEYCCSSLENNFVIGVW